MTAKRAGLLLIAALAATPALSATSDSARTPRSTARLLTDTDAYAPGRPLHVALELVPAAGWHTYWRNPGDAGVAPEFALNLPPGVTAGPIAWPLPVRISDGGVMSFGYTDPVLLARTVTPQAALSGPLAITAEARWLICAQVCVPQSARITLTLPPGTPSPSADAAAMAASAARVPKPSPYLAHIAPDGALWLTGVPPDVTHAVFLPDASDTTLLDAPQPIRRDSDRLTLKLTPTPAFRASTTMTGVLVSNGVGTTITATPAAPPVRAGAPALLVTLLLAVAGGALLNLMPCVFPVLAMKAMSLAALSTTARRQVRGLALSYSAGVLATFLGLGIVLLALRAAGTAAGWGFQFRYPAFVAGMAWLFFAIGLGLSGAFTLPAAGFGQGAASRRGHVGSFAAGLLAVLVASPCTAPFMAAAVAASATAPAGTALLLFLGMGTGFAAPTLLIAVRPALIPALPKPGRWMQRLQQALAFPMYAAAVWLVWVLIEEIGAAEIPAVGAGFVLIAVAAWLWNIANRPSRTLAAAALLSALAILPGIARNPPPQANQARFTADRLQQLRQSGRPVLVNMTAAWCVTCLVNERAAIRPALPALQAAGITYLTGDWTRQDPDISDFLRHYGRDGVPLYVFFAAGGAPGRVLPQLLTPGLLIRLGG